MALIRCPECQKEISDTINTCIRCGYKIKNDNSLNQQTILEENDKSNLFMLKIAGIVLIPILYIILFLFCDIIFRSFDIYITLKAPIIIIELLVTFFISYILIKKMHSVESAKNILLTVVTILVIFIGLYFVILKK